jgi:hypothetical protein
VKYSTNTSSEEVSVNIKKISIYFAHDSFEALQKLLTCTEHNLKALVQAGEVGASQANQVLPEEQKQSVPQVDDCSEFQDISEKGESQMVNLNEEAVKQILPLQKKSELLFVIDQINAQNMRRKGQSFVEIDELAKDNYIPVPKKVGVKQLWKYKKSHSAPKVACAPNQVNPESFLNLKLQVQLHI